MLPLSRDDFVREVTEASRDAPVVLLLFKDSIEGSALLTGILQRVRRSRDGGGGLQCPARCSSDALADFLYSPPHPSPPPQLSSAHRATKFLQIGAQACIEGYPDRNVPTVFVYRDGAVAANIVGMAEFGGLRATDASESVGTGAVGARRVHVSAPAGGGRAPASQHLLPPAAPRPRAAVEWVLAEHGALETELESDPRLKLPRGGAGRG